MLEVRRMLTPFQVATSSRTLVVCSRDLADLPAHDPGDPAGPVAVADEDGLGVEAALDAVERRHRLAVAAVRTISSPSGTWSRSNACSGCAVISIT